MDNLRFQWLKIEQNSDEGHISLGEGAFPLDPCTTTSYMLNKQLFYEIHKVKIVNSE